MSFSFRQLAGSEAADVSSASRPWFVMMSLLLLAGGCDRNAAESRPASSLDSTKQSASLAEPPPQSSASSDTAAPAPRQGGQTESAGVTSAFKYPAAERIVAIGDLHGDFLATEKAFRLAGAIDEKGNWAGGALVVVQTGDQLDRGDDEEKILSFLKRLKVEAAKAGGVLHVLNGNHETMNVLGDFRYVTPGGFLSFESWAPASPWAVSAPAQYQARARAFLPGGGAARAIATQPLVIMVGDTVFAHAGVISPLVDYGIDKLNAETRAWMEGKVQTPPSPVTDPDGPVWTRLYGAAVLEPGACAILTQTLEKLGARRMVVGHTVQEHGLASACEDRVFRIDVGLAHYYGDHPVQVLEISGGRTKILTAKD